VLLVTIAAPGGASVACFGAAATGHSTLESFPKHYNNQNSTNTDDDGLDGAHLRLLPRQTMFSPTRIRNGSIAAVTLGVLYLAF
jgi:hypothetical protein